MDSPVQESTLIVRNTMSSSVSVFLEYAFAFTFASIPESVSQMQTCLSYNQPMSLPGHISKLEAALDRVYPPPVTRTNRQNAAENANLTASDLRETRQREAKSESVRKAVGVQIRVGKGLLALAAKEYERAGRELGLICEEGGLAESEGQVGRVMLAL